MMISALALALALQEAAERRDPWIGFGPGSWVVISRRTKDGEKVTERKEKHVLLEPREGTPRRQTFEEKEGAFVPTSKETTHVQGAEAAGSEWGEAKTRAEELTVDGKKLACTVSEHVVEKEEAKGKLVVWRTADAKIPYREIVRDGPDIALTADIVRLEVSIERGTRKDAHAVRVVAFGEKLKVGTRELACAVEEWKAEETRGGVARTGTFKRWLSNDVPGRVARMEGRLVSAGKTAEMTQETVDFAVKP